MTALCFPVVDVFLLFFSLADRQTTGEFLDYYNSLVLRYASEPERPAKVRDVRLPLHLVPEGDRVRLLPALEDGGDFTFSGEVTLTLLAAAAGRNVTVHVKDLVVENDTIAVRDTTADAALTVGGVRYDADREFLVILLERDVQPQHRHDVTIRYTGNLKDKLAGFYRSSYVDPEGRKR